MNHGRHREHGEMRGQVNWLEEEGALGTALSNALLQQIAPRVIPVRVAPVLGLVLENFRRAIGAGVLG
jgi:hypothetical protein